MPGVLAIGPPAGPGGGWGDIFATLRYADAVAEREGALVAVCRTEIAHLVKRVAGVAEVPGYNPL